jgi:hypothetical protein
MIDLGVARWACASSIAAVTFGVGCKCSKDGPEIGRMPTAGACASAATSASAAPDGGPPGPQVENMPAQPIDGPHSTIMPAQHVDIAVDVAQLLKDYKDNERRGDSKYKGKRVRLTGKAGDIRRGLTKAIYLTVGTGSGLEVPEAQCFFGDEYAARVASIHHGQPVLVNCVVEGFMKNVLMKDCSFPSLTTLNVCMDLKNAGVVAECSGTDGDEDVVLFYISPSSAGLLAPCPDVSECQKKVNEYLLRYGGGVYLMKDDNGYVAFLGAVRGFDQMMPFGSPSARIIVVLPSTASLALQAKTKAVVDHLPPATD